MSDRVSGPSDADGLPPPPDPRPLAAQMAAPAIARVRQIARARTPAQWVGALVGATVAVVVVWWLLRPAPPPVEIGVPVVAADGTLAAGPSAVVAAVPSGPPSAAGAAEPVVAGAAAGAQESAGPVGPGQPSVGDGSGATWVVHVAGAVRHPGVYRLTAGSRGADAVEAAGGARPDADLARVNLAAPLADGQHLVIPAQGEPVPPAAEVTASGGQGPGGRGPGGGAPIDLNTADLADLDALPGIGPATAQAIIDHRTRSGPFRRVEDLLEVRGIGPAKLDAIRAAVRV